MCDQHHAASAYHYARNAICSWRCQQLGHGHKADLPTLRRYADDRVGRAKAASYGLCAGSLIHVTALQSLPFHLYESGRDDQPGGFTGNTRRDVLGRLRQPWHLLSSVSCRSSRLFAWSSFCCWSTASGCPLSLKSNSRGSCSS